MFLRESGAGYLLLALAILSLLLAAIDTSSQLLRPVREALVTAVSPVYYLSDLPYSVSSSLGTSLSSRGALLEENRELRERVRELSAQAQRLTALREENARLRDLLGSRRQVEDRVLVAELIGARPSPERHQMVLDKGAGSGVYQGQAVLDAHGLFGQIIEVAEQSSVVMLIADRSHAVPVQVARNDYRSIAAGTGALDRLELEHVPVTADIVEGDMLVSSGMGGRFPRGYPVARVVSVSVDAGAHYARVSARPLAALDRSRHVLLVFPETEVEPAEPFVPELLEPIGSLFEDEPR